MPDSAKLFHQEPPRKDEISRDRLKVIKGQSAELAKEPWRIGKALAQDRRWSRRKALFRDFLEIWLSARDGKAFPTQKQIAFRLQASVRCVREMIAEATHLGYVIPIRERRNQYYVALSDGSQPKWRRGTNVPLQRGTNVPHSSKAPETKTPEQYSECVAADSASPFSLRSKTPPSLRSVGVSALGTREAASANHTAGPDSHLTVREEIESPSPEPQTPAQADIGNFPARACEPPDPTLELARTNPSLRPPPNEPPRQPSLALPPVAIEPLPPVTGFAIALSFALGWDISTARRRAAEVRASLPPDANAVLERKPDPGDSEWGGRIAAILASHGWRPGGW